MDQPWSQSHVQKLLFTSTGFLLAYDLSLNSINEVNCFGASQPGLMNFLLIFYLIGSAVIYGVILRASLYPLFPKPWGPVGHRLVFEVLMGIILGYHALILWFRVKATSFVGSICETAGENLFKSYGCGKLKFKWISTCINYFLFSTLPSDFRHYVKYTSNAVQCFVVVVIAVILYWMECGRFNGGGGPPIMDNSQPPKPTAPVTDPGNSKPNPTTSPKPPSTPPTPPASPPKPPTPPASPPNPPPEENKDDGDCSSSKKSKPNSSSSKSSQKDKIAPKVCDVCGFTHAQDNKDNGNKKSSTTNSKGIQDDDCGCGPKSKLSPTDYDPDVTQNPINLNDPENSHIFDEDIAEEIQDERKEDSSSDNSTLAGEKVQDNDGNSPHVEDSSIQMFEESLNNSSQIESTLQNFSVRDGPSFVAPPDNFVSTIPEISSFSTTTTLPEDTINENVSEVVEDPTDSTAIQVPDIEISEPLPSNSTPSHDDTIEIVSEDENADPTGIQSPISYSINREESENADEPSTSGQCNMQGSQSPTASDDNNSPPKDIPQTGRRGSSLLVPNTRSSARLRQLAAQEAGVPILPSISNTAEDIQEGGPSVRTRRMTSLANSESSSYIPRGRGVRERKPRGSRGGGKGRGN